MSVIADPHHFVEVTWIERSPNCVGEILLMLSCLLEAYEIIISEVRDRN